jgi:hypothetical protein
MKNPDFKKIKYIQTKILTSYQLKQIEKHYNNIKSTLLDKRIPI